MSAAKERGQLGEQLTAEYLQRRGWNILARNWHSRYGEIDIIAEDGRYLAFVEVKLRKSARFGAACEAVTGAKMAKLRKTAVCYLMAHDNGMQPRFDVAEVYLPDGGTPVIDYLENAFE